MPEIRILQTLRDINPNNWNACFTGVAENYGYLLAVEEAGLQGFSWSYATAWEKDRLIAAMPAFFTDYALDTTLQGKGKHITTALKSAFPKLLTVKLACLGSPCAEAGIVGFRPEIVDKPALLQAMATEFESYAIARGCRLIGIKDIPETMELIWNLAICARGYADLPGLPTAYLDIDFSTMDEYVARLSAATRKDMRRKLRAAEIVEIQHVTALDTLLPEIMLLYHDTRNRSEWQFEELTEEYFRGVLANMKGQSFCTLYYVHGQLLAANLLVHDNHTLIDKFFCMNSEFGREYNLYFLSWFTNIRTCLERGFVRYQSGQAYYENKLRLGSKLTRNQMYFKHRNALAQRILKLVSPMLAADDTAKEAA